jgi:hypothetical protein
VVLTEGETEMEHTLIVAPNHIAALSGVAVIRVGVRKLWACDAQLNTLFSCPRRYDDDVTQDFLGLVRLIASRAAR